MSSVKLTPKSSSKQQPPKFVVGTKSINEIPGPVLATFGDFPALESVDPTGEDPLLFDAYTIEAKKLVTKNAPVNDNNIFNQQYILKGETSVIEYHASTHNSKRANQSKYIIGIFDPSKNEVELVPVPGLFMMEQAAKNVKLFFETPEEDVRKRSARALQVFGATGAKNLSKRMTLDSLHDGTGNVTEGMVEDLKNHLAENPDNLREGPKIEYFSDLPSPDTTTREVTEVYDPLKIIPESIWPGIPRIFAKTPATKLVEKYHLRPVLLKILKHPYITKRAHLSTKILKERLIIYAALLGSLRDEPKLAVASFGRSHVTSRGLSEFILSTFAIPERGVDVYTVNRQTYYRAANYAAVALLIAFDLSLDNETVEDFATLVNLSPEEVKVVFDRVGCTITKAGVKLVQPWKVWENASKQNTSILERYVKARKRSLERIKANQQKEKEESEAQQAEDDGVDPNAMNLEEDEEEPVKEESTFDDDDNDFVSGVKGGSEKKRARKSIGEKPKEDPLNKKKKM